MSWNKKWIRHHYYSRPIFEKSEKIKVKNIFLGRSDGCGHGFGGCDALGGLGGFNGLSGFGGFEGFDGFCGFDRLDGFEGFSGFDGFSGFGGFVF